jgi:hypothetical protein
VDLAGIAISTVYDLGMAKHVYIQLFASAHGGDTPVPIRIRADKFEKKEGGGMVLKIGNDVVGEFLSPIAGWWIQDE